MSGKGKVQPLRSLREVVLQAHLGMALMAVALASTLLLLVGGVALRVYLGHNLQLMARSLAYTVEAAAVFSDHAEAQQVLDRMLPGEGVAQAQVLLRGDRVFVQWQQPADTMAQRWGVALANVVRLAPATAVIRNDGELIGRVQLCSDGQGLLQFLLAGLGVLLLCTAISGLVGLVWSRRMLGDMVAPLQDLARVARSVRHDRALDDRVPPARIAEMRALGDDFNALLDELQAHQAQLAAHNDALQRQVAHDALTGASTRAHFEQSLVLALAQAAGSQAQLAVLFLDNDHFKQVNDRYGHSAGDALLVVLAQRMRAQVRGTDIVARFGGDEFAVLLSPVAGEGDAWRIATKMLDAMHAPVPLPDGRRLQPSVSVGIALYPAHGQSMPQLLDAADQAMYQAKTQGRARVCVATL